MYKRQTQNVQLRKTRLEVRTLQVALAAENSPTVTIPTLLFSNSYLTPQLSFTSTKACIANLNNFIHSHPFRILIVPTGSPSRRGDVMVYVTDINHRSLPTPFDSVLVSLSVFMVLQRYFIP